LRKNDGWLIDGFIRLKGILLGCQLALKLLGLNVVQDLVSLVVGDEG